MYTPTHDDEVTGLVQYLGQQLDAIRAASIGLTEEQARLTPCRSALSIGGLLKHTTHGMRGATERLTSDGEGDGTRVMDAAAFAAYESSFVLGDDESAAAVLAEFDAARVAYLAAVTTTDPDGATLEPPSPWFGIFDARPANARFFLVHQVEEMARHAGHADIIREQIDGVSVPAIVLSEAGMPAGDFFQPYVPAPGMIGSR